MNRLNQRTLEDYTKELMDLRQLVSSQQLVIEKLQGQLSSIASILGITDTVDEMIGDTLPASAPASATNPPGNLLDDHANCSINGAVSESAVWADVVKR